MTEWKNRPEGFGAILDYGDFYISYNPMDELNSMFSFFGSDDGSPETALCKEGEFFILNGDARKEYEAFGNDWDKCYEFYLANIDSSSSWSNKCT